LATASLLIEQALERVPVKKDEFMEPIFLKNVISDKELYFIYSELTAQNLWNVTGVSDNAPKEWKTQFNMAPTLNACNNGEVHIYPYYIWASTVVYRIESMLQKQNKSIPTKIKRSIFNITYSNNNQHFLHIDGPPDRTSILLFLTPVWFPDGEGAFYVDGKKFDFTPGAAVIFKSDKYHKGEPPSQKMKSTSWMRLTCNILLEED
jgi:hypothetical protein